MRDQPLSSICAPVGTPKDREGGRYLYIGPPDLIPQIRKLERQIAVLESQTQTHQSKRVEI